MISGDALPTSPSESTAIIGRKSFPLVRKVAILGAASALRDRLFRDLRRRSNSASAQPIKCRFPTI